MLQIIVIISSLSCQVDSKYFIHKPELVLTPQTTLLHPRGPVAHRGGGSLVGRAAALTSSHGALRAMGFNDVFYLVLALPLTCSVTSGG